MNTLTPSLNLIILIATIAPTSFTYSLASVFRNRNEQTSADNSSLLFLLTTLAMTICSIAILRPDIFVIHTITQSFLIISIIGAVLCIFIEYSLNAGLLYLSTGRVPKQITLHQYWKGFPLGLLFLTLLIAVGEEMLYRLVWFEILINQFKAPLVITLFLSSLCYGLNHLFFGYVNVLSKFVCGLVYGALYVAGGYSIAAPIIAHVLQNLLLIILAKGRTPDA